MKKCFLFSLAAMALLASCSSTKPFYYQRCSVGSDLPVGSNGAYEHKSPDCAISYDFWSDGGRIEFAVTNLTDKVLTVDLTKSFLIKNGIASDYYLNRVYTSSNGSVVSSSDAATSTAWRSWISTLVTVSSTSSSTSSASSSVAYCEKPVVLIPPHSTKTFGEYTVMSSRYLDCSLKSLPSEKDKQSIEFTAANSPVRFTNYVCYRVGDDKQDKVVTNDFYVSQVANVNPKSMVKSVDAGCPGYKTSVDVMQGSTPRGFYVRYVAPEEETSGPQKDKKGDGEKTKYWWEEGDK